MRHSETGVVLRNSFIGISWTYLFFGFFVSLYRGEMIDALVGFIISATLIFVHPLLYVAYVSFMACIYNRVVMHRHLERGYRFSDTVELNAMAAESVGFEF